MSVIPPHLAIKICFIIGLYYYVVRWLFIYLSLNYVINLILCSLKIGSLFLHAPQCHTNMQEIRLLIDVLE